LCVIHEIVSGMIPTTTTTTRAQQRALRT